MTLNVFQSYFDRALIRFFKQKSGKIGSLGDAFLQEILAYPQQLLLSGKRVRPYVASLMFRACGGKSGPELYNMLVALELFHLFGLVHDDIIDHGKTRHGIPTLHLHVADRLKRAHRLGDSAHIGSAQALLVGDLLFSWSMELLSKNTAFSVSAQQAARESFFHMAEEVVMGQMLDVDLTTRPAATNALVMKKMELKTASYTFVRPLEIGAALAEHSVEYKSFCRKIGIALGLAFQIQDDLFDLTTPPKDSKKTIFSDLAERQHTLFTQYIFDHGTKKQKAELMSLMGRALSEKERPQITRLFTETGAIEYGKQEIEKQFRVATKVLYSAKFSQEIQTEFENLINLMRHRHA